MSGERLGILRALHDLVNERVHIGRWRSLPQLCADQPKAGLDDHDEISKVMSDAGRKSAQRLQLL